MGQNKTTKKHFEIFKKECLRVINLLGITDWHINFKHAKLQVDQTDLAWLTWSFIGHEAVICLATDWEVTKITTEELIDSARHEVLELFIAPLKELVYQRSFDEDKTKAEGHRIIHIIKNRLLK